MAISIASLTDGRAPFSTWVRIVAAAVTATILGASLVALTHSGMFHVRAITVEGNAHLHRPEIVRLSGLSKQTNAVWLDEAEVEARLEQDPWIATAEVSCSLSGAVRLSITERTPVAVVERGTERSLVAADGTMLAGTWRGGLPRIIALPPWLDASLGFDVGDAARVIGSMSPPLRSRVRRVTVTPASTLVVALDGGVRITYGPPTALAAKAAAVEGALAWAESGGERIRSIDVLAPGAPAVALAG